MLKTANTNCNSNKTSNIEKRPMFFLCLLLLVAYIDTLQPFKESLLFPNTQSSPSLYLISFKTNKNIPANSYILISMSWYPSDLSPFKCIFVNQSINVQCTNLKTPAITLSISTAIMQLHNPSIADDKTLVVDLGTNTLTKDTEYVLQVSLFNPVPNIQKISPSMEFYIVSKNGLVYEENLSYGPVINKPPFNNLLAVSILNDLQTNEPGKFSDLKAEFQIGIAVSTPLSSFIFVLPYPFEFSVGSIVKPYAAEAFASNRIDLYKAPALTSYQALSKNIFTVTFNESFIVGRKFQLEVTEISNPFYLARSNISIYSTNFGSLTPNQGYQELYPIQTVTFPMTVTIGLPYDTPISGPCQFYRNTYNYVKIKIVIPNSIPNGYAIRIYSTHATIRPGTAYTNFHSTAYQPIYQYETLSNRRLVIKKMGPIVTGTIVQVTMKIFKDLNTNFNFDVWIDTEDVIAAQVLSARYMFEGTVIGTSVDFDNFNYQRTDSIALSQGRIITEGSSIDLNNYYFQIKIHPNGLSTSTGSYLQLFFPPLIEMEGTFNQNTHCTFGASTAATCAVTQTSNFLRITIKRTDGSIAFPNSWTQVRIRRIKITKTSSNKNIYPFYMRLFRTEGGGAEYIRSDILTVIVQQNTQIGASLETYGGTSNTGYKYPSFLRFQITDPTGMSYTINQNQERVVTIFAFLGYKGLGAGIMNQGEYPCTSNIQVKCVYEIGHQDNAYYLMEWERIHVFFPGSQENTVPFHVIIPMIIPVANNNFYYYMAGVYNSFFKVKQYKYMDDYVSRSSWPSSPPGLQPTMSIDFEGKAGSYRKNVTVEVVTNTAMNTLPYCFLVIVTKWSFFQQGTSKLTLNTLSGTNPVFGTQTMQPLSVYIGEHYYMTAVPFQYTSSLTSFIMHFDDVHMPYTYDLPDYHIFVTNSNNPPTGSPVSDINSIIAYNEFILTSAGVFYESPLKSLTVSCLDNSLGVLNTICTMEFGTNHPLKANGTIRIQFSGMVVATDECILTVKSDSSEIPVQCASTEDNVNVTVTLTGNKIGHYPPNVFQLKVHGIGIDSTSISHSFTLYVMDSTSQYVIEKGNRILTTTVVNNKIIQLKQIMYRYTSPLSANVISIRFSLPRKLYDDEDLGFIMGKDLSDANTEINRLNIRLTNSDSGTVLSALYQLISNQYKVIFTFYDITQLVAGNYTLQIFGIMTPASHENGAFNIIYQRKFDKVYSMINQNSDQTGFPAFNDLIISNISTEAFYNTQGYGQQLQIKITNQNYNVDDAMIWIVNFPSYYIDKLFNYDPYCLIDGTPIECYADPDTPFQLIIKSSPKIISNGTQYIISIIGLASPRSVYTGDLFPNRYIFVGVLQNEASLAYIETVLLYPQQTIQSTVNGIITLQDIPLASTNQPAFSSIFAVLNLFTNHALTAGSYLYIDFPQQFDNFNNMPLTITLSVPTFTPASITAVVINRRVQIELPISIPSIPMNTAFTVTFPSLPTPKLVSTVVMSQTSIYVAASNKKSIYAASMISGNSAPTLSFFKDPRYIMFNSDETIEITAGTFSELIDIKSSDGNPFLNNVYVTLSSIGFTFQPSQVLLSVGDKKGVFRVGADPGLLPVSYFYSAIKTQETISSYTITLNNNIRVTNTPVVIVIPTIIVVPIGGCSLVQQILLPNAPINDIMVTFNYDNNAYNDSVFWFNRHTTNSEILFNNTVTSNYLSFCSASTVAPASFILSLVLAGTNYASYKMSPSQKITINLQTQPVPSTLPTISLALINQQRTFLDISFTTNQQGNIYYHILRGANMIPMSSSDLQVKVKTNAYKIKSMTDFMSHLYLNDRDQRVGLFIQPAGSKTFRFENLLPQTPYTFCVYLQNMFNKISTAVCKNYQTSAWGTITKVSAKFTKSLNDQQLNNVLCFFTKFVGTSNEYVINSNGNSCDNRKVKNLYYNFAGQSFSHERTITNIYLVTNPYLVSDPSPTALQNMYDSSLSLTGVSLSSAVGFTINYLNSTYLIQSDARKMSAANLAFMSIQSEENPADSLEISFNKPYFDSATSKIIVPDVQILNGPGSVYFVLVLYKRFVKNGTQTYVNIRMNIPPNQQQVLNCQTWQNLTAEGCARAIFTSQIIDVSFSNIATNSMYLLYYAAASDYPLRPVLSNTITSYNVITYVFQHKLALFATGFLIFLIVL